MEEEKKEGERLGAVVVRPRPAAGGGTRAGGNARVREGAAAAAESWRAGDKRV